jgi:hypothetical protein
VGDAGGNADLSVLYPGDRSFVGAGDDDGDVVFDDNTSDSAAGRTSRASRHGGANADRAQPGAVTGDRAADAGPGCVGGRRRAVARRR